MILSRSGRGRWAASVCSKVNMKTAPLVSAMIAILLTSCRQAATETPVLRPTLVPTSTPSFTSTPTPAPTSSPTPSPTPTARALPPVGAFILRTDFDGIASPFGFGGPDLTIAAGPTSLVLAMNRSIGIMDKAGVLIDFKRMEDFFSPLRDLGVQIGTDPKLLYDPQSQRFFLSKADYQNGPGCSPCFSYITIAVSRSNSPTSLSEQDWYFFTFDRDVQRTASTTVYTGYVGDFDNLSMTEDVLAISWLIDHSADPRLYGVEDQMRFFDKSSLINGISPDNWIDVDGFSSIVAQNVGRSDRFYSVNGVPSDFKVWAIDNSLPLPTVSSTRPARYDAALNDPPSAPQRGGPPIDLLAGKGRAIYHDGSLWIADVFRQDFGSGIVSAIWWMELDVTDWPATKITQSGVLGEDAVWYFAPVIMANNGGNFVILYARSSRADFVSTHFTGRLAADPPNMLRPCNLLVSGEVPYSRFEEGRNRFLDYMGIALDPVDGSVWMMALYPKGGDRSGSWVGNMDWTVSPGS